MRPPHPIATRFAAAVLLALAALTVPQAILTGARAATAALDPTARWPLLTGAFLGGSELALGLALAGLTAATGILLLVRPEAGRFLAIVAALAWLPVSCGAVSVLVLALAWFPAEAPPATPT